jgi:hypothetical protein
MIGLLVAVLSGAVRPRVRDALITAAWVFLGTLSIDVAGCFMEHVLHGAAARTPNPWWSGIGVPAGSTRS